MGYEISDVSGVVDSGPSISGLASMKKLAAAQAKGQYPALEHFIEYGHTTKLIALTTECNNLAKQATDEDVKHSFQQLAATARKCKEIIVLSH